MLTIGKTALLARVSPDTLRYYEREGLIEPATKTQAGYRLYDSGQLQRLRFIRHAQECGFTLAEIRQLIAVRDRPSSCCGDVRRLAIEKKLQLEAKIKAMRSMSRTLDAMIADCGHDGRPVDVCPILAGLDANPDGAELKRS